MSQSPEISFDAFLAVDVDGGGSSTYASSAARKAAYQLEVDFGPEFGRRRSQVPARSATPRMNSSVDGCSPS
jgi:hypothetical protein